VAGVGVASHLEEKVARDWQRHGRGIRDFEWNLYEQHLAQVLVVLRAGRWSR
jgi:hypothetical protein